MHCLACNLVEVTLPAVKRASLIFLGVLLDRCQNASNLTTRNKDRNRAKYPLSLAICGFGFVNFVKIISAGLKSDTRAENNSQRQGVLQDWFFKQNNSKKDLFFCWFRHILQWCHNHGTEWWSIAWSDNLETVRNMSIRRLGPQFSTWTKPAKKIVSNSLRPFFTRSWCEILTHIFADKRQKNVKVFFCQTECPFLLEITGQQS